MFNFRFGDFVYNLENQYIALDGNKETYQVNGTPPAGKMCCLVCCPCFVPPLCSVHFSSDLQSLNFQTEKQRQWRNFVKSFSFIISAIQIILLIVAFGLGGFAPFSEVCDLLL